MPAAGTVRAERSSSGRFAMGLYCSLHRVSDEQIAHLLQHPEELECLLDALEIAEDEGLEGGDEEEIEEHLPALGEQLDLEKDWHALHFLLTGTADGGDEPWCYLLAGGKSIGDGSDGWTAQALASQQVKRFADALAGISPSDLLARYDPDKMTALDIYPSVIWSRDPQDELKVLLADSFESLRSFVQEAAVRKLGLIVYIG